MIKILVLGLLITLNGQYTPSGPVFAHGGGGCVAPTAFETSQWPAYGAGVTCVTSCAGGGSINLIPDTVGSLNLAGNTGSYAEPFYAPAAFGALSAGWYLGTPNALKIGSSGIPTSVTSVSFWATIQPDIPGSGHNGIIGGATNGTFEWRINSTGHQELLVANTTLLGAGSATFTNGGKYTIAVTLNTTTGAWAMYTMAGGVVTLDNSGPGTGPITFTGPITQFGLANNTTDGFSGKILDAGYFAGISGTPALNATAAWSNCNAGV